LLAPLIQRDIYLRALIGRDGSRRREFVSADSQFERISSDSRVLKDRFAEPPGAA